MTTRREERERMRQERLAAQQAASSAEKRRLYLGYAVAGVIVVAIVAGIVVAIAGGGSEGDGASPEDFPELAYVQPNIGAVPDYMEPDGRDGTDPPALQLGDLEAAAEAANCDLQLNLPDDGNDHFDDEDRVPNYKTNPPTSGDHYGVLNETASGALADGAWLNTPPVARAVHSMEHGRILIQYSPQLSEEEQLEIKGVFEESPQGVLMFPNPDMPYEVAVTAWTQLAGCRDYQGPETLDVIRDFRDVYRGICCENFPLAA